MRRLYCVAGVLLLLALINPYAAKADTTIGEWGWTGALGAIPVSGTATFIALGSASPYTLEIILSNNSSTIPTSVDDMLTGLDFTISGQGTTPLVMSSAVAANIYLTSGLTSPTAGDANTDVCAPGSGGTAGAPTCTIMAMNGGLGGWEAAYLAAGFAANANDKWGIGTTQQTSVYTSADVQTDNFGIAPTVGDGTVGNTGANAPYIDGTATFILTGVQSSTVPTISNVIGVYGATPLGTFTPEPASIGTFAGGFVLLALAWRRRRVR
jgi:hypothetical protein